MLPVFPARVTFWPLPLLPEFPDPRLPPPELVQWTTPFVPSGVVVGVQEPGAGGVGGPLVDETRVSDVVPDAFITCDEVAVASLGHQARSHPSATVATTSCPLSSTRVTPVTPDATRPLTSVYGPSAVERCDCTTFWRSPEVVPATVTVDRLCEGLPEPEPEPLTLSTPFEASPPELTWVTCVKEELVKQPM